MILQIKVGVKFEATAELTMQTPTSIVGVILPSDTIFINADNTSRDVPLLWP